MGGSPSKFSLVRLFELPPRLPTDGEQFVKFRAPHVSDVIAEAFIQAPEDGRFSMQIETAVVDDAGVRHLRVRVTVAAKASRRTKPVAAVHWSVN